jgi:hypothetical protein
MSDAAIGILGNRDRWQAMSALAAADARERFSLDAIVPEYEAFYEYTLAQPSTIDRAFAPAPRAADADAR